ncbi:MAG: CoA transferase [Proteobacteria bacterium]|nr:CoA transferase [Pseudomonadota bacterium]
MSTNLPLQNIRVLDLTQVFAGPYCTYQLALLGAQVIKIEPPGGEMTRYGGALPELSKQGLGLSFCTQNAQKSCVELDLKKPQAVAQVLALAAEADVFVQNFRPGVARRLGLGEDALAAVNARLVYCSISAYGEVGPIGHRPAYDHVVQAMSGIMCTTGSEDMGPVKVGAPYIDYATGLNAAFAVMAGLRQRDQDGKFQLLDVSMLDTAMTMMANNLVTVATTGSDLPKLGNEAASRAPSSGCFTTQCGGLLMLAANNERQFADLCRVLEHPQWSADPRWANPIARRDNQQALRELFEQVFLTAPATHWEALLDAAGVPASRVRHLSETVAEGQLQARGMLTELEVGEDATAVSLPGVGFRLNGASLTPDQAPRSAGADAPQWSERYSG